MPWISLLFGSIVGVSLGLTGGGGAIFAVPLLAYGLGVPAREAVAISLVSVGLTSFVGFLAKWRKGEAELRTGLLFAAAGMLGAPVGSWIAAKMPETWLMLLFAGLMLKLAVSDSAAVLPSNSGQARCVLTAALLPLWPSIPSRPLGLPSTGLP